MFSLGRSIPRGTVDGKEGGTFWLWQDSAHKMAASERQEVGRRGQGSRPLWNPRVSLGWFEPCLWVQIRPPERPGQPKLWKQRASPPAAFPQPPPHHRLELDSFLLGFTISFSVSDYAHDAKLNNLGACHLQESELCMDHFQPKQRSCLGFWSLAPSLCLGP